MTIYAKKNAKGRPTGQWVTEVTRHGKRTRHITVSLEEAQEAERSLHGVQGASADRFAPPNDAEARQLRKATALIDAFRAVDSAMPIGYAAAFLAVALRPGLGVTAYAELVGMKRPVASRVLLEIGKKSRQGGPGYELVDSVQNSEDLRNVNYYLTPKGKRLLAGIGFAIGS